MRARHAFLLILSLTSASMAVARPAEPPADKPAVINNENLIYSVFIYHFTKYVKWPVGNRYDTGDFVIGVLGDTPMMGELEKIAREKKVEDRRIVIHQFKSAGEVSELCHILYLAPNASGQFDEVQKKTRYLSTLVVTHKDGLGQNGSQINFVKHEGKPRFELNEEMMVKKQLRYAVALKSIAIVL